ncbi:MAG: EAL and HDOD domain-containing protein, partial [Burkholderiales bacterium]
MSMQQEAFIARQPILNTTQDIIGYELLFRANAQAREAHVTHDVSAGASVLINMLNNMGPEQLLGGKLAFINVFAPMLGNPMLELLPAKRVVLEIAAPVSADEAVLSRISALRGLGFAIALDNFRGDTAQPPLLALADYIKVDVRQTEKQGLQQLARGFVGQHTQLIAQKIESKSEFEFAKQLGINLFQGFHFARPETLTTKVIQP